MKTLKKLDEKFLNIGYYTLVGFLLLFIFSCTIIPRFNTPKYPLFSGTNLNAGILYFTNFNHSAVITEQAAKKYNLLITQYGHYILPEITNGYGLSYLTNNTYLITPDGLYYFMVFARWHRNNLTN